MRVLMKTEPGWTDLHLTEVPRPVCGEGEVVLKVRAAGICGSDLHIYRGDFSFPLPLVMGHEFCGEIAELGAGVTGWSVGDFVVSNLGGTCGACQCCRDGNSHLCLHKRSPGLFSYGAYAEYVKTRADMLYRAPAGVSDEMLACTEPACVVMHGLKRIGVRPGDTVVVAGVGLIGLLTILMSKRIFGAGRIIAVGITPDEPKRLPLARQYGADVTINAQKTDLVPELLRQFPPECKADVVIDCSGAPSTIQALFQVVKRAGTYGAIGLPPRDVDIPVNWYDLVFGSVNIISTYSHEAADWEDVLRCMADGTLDFRDSITHILPLEDWEQVFKSAGDPNFIKAVFRPNG